MAGESVPPLIIITSSKTRNIIVIGKGAWNPDCYQISSSNDALQFIIIFFQNDKKAKKEAMEERVEIFLFHHIPILHFHSILYVVTPTA